MAFLRSVGGLMAFLAAAWGVLAQGRSEARLLVDSLTVRSGSSFMAAIELVSPEGWHTYWRNPGDSGQRTKIEWTLPEGVTASEILWPAPNRLTEAGLTTYIYEGRVLLPVRFSVANGLPSGILTLQARVSWLECKTECVPGRTNVTASLTVGEENRPSPDQTAIALALAGLPKPDPAILAAAQWTGPTTGDARLLSIQSSRPGLQDFYPYERTDAEIVRAAGTPTSPEGISFSVARSGAGWPAEVAGLLVFGSGGNRREVVAATLPIARTPESPAAPTATLPGLLPMLGLAFLGGLVLNIMPCVLPVIALKILGFVKQSRENPRHIRFLGLVYTAGVLVSFGVLAGVIIAVQSAGRTASWGMQFQNPVFLVAITTLVTLVALNLFGVFEVTLNADALGAASNLASREGPAGAFFNGVFTTVLATPCTAPFLGAALGFAFGQPPLLLLLLFLTAALGLATPYLLLSLQPAWLKFLPKPGNWMLTFKTLMGFPMMATAVWLLSLASDHFGETGVFWVGMFQVCVSVAAWLFGKYVQSGSGSRIWSWGAVGALLGAGYLLILESELHWRDPKPAPGGPAGTVKSGGISWEPWSAEAVSQARAAGHPVFVDFTAKWCFTCKVNKAVAIEVPAVAARLASLGAVTLRGDYTREDPLIARELPKFGRAGVPLVLVYPKNPDLPPRVLPEQLTESRVLEALNWAAN